MLGLAAIGCGGRTEPFDDVRDEGDGVPMTPPFSTLPCRWTLGRELVIPDGEPSAAASIAAIHGTRDEAVVQGLGAAYVIALGDPPTLLREARSLRGPTFGTSNGWISVVEGDASCALAHLSDDLETESRDQVVDAWRCAASARTVESVDVFAGSESRARLFSVDARTRERTGEVDLNAEVASTSTSATRETSGSWTAVTIRDVDALTLHRASPTGFVVSLRTGVRGPAETAVDRLRGGLVLLRLDPPSGRWLVERVPGDGDLRVERVAEIDSVEVPASWHIATNETEALVPLSNGRIAVAALNGIDPYTIGPLLDDPSRTFVNAVIALRSGTSVGGVAYSSVGPDSPSYRLAFRTLVCNR